jgi:hypothetical protein
MKNIHILPTDKDSKLYLGNLGKPVTIQSASAQFKKPLHIYITSDEEIKINEYYLCKLSMNIKKCIGDEYFNNIDEKKIILTTDQHLIKDGVQAIDDEFLEWFVKNPSCEEVEVRSFIDAFEWRTIYKIIIPKEEKDYTALLQPVGTKQETIEEIAERYYEDEVSINAFINGYKLAKEQFKNK